MHPRRGDFFARGRLGHSGLRMHVVELADLVHLQYDHETPVGFFSSNPKPPPP